MFIICDVNICGFNNRGVCESPCVHIRGNAGCAEFYKDNGAQKNQQAVDAGDYREYARIMDAVL